MIEYALWFAVGVVVGWNISIRLPLKYRPTLRDKINLAPKLKRKLRRWV